MLCMVRANHFIFIQNHAEQPSYMVKDQTVKQTAKNGLSRKHTNTKRKKVSKLKKLVRICIS